MNAEHSEHSSQMANILSRNCSASVDYISASVNRHSHAADVSNDSTVAFGSSSLIAIWPASEDENAGVQQTLIGHEGRATCIRFKEEDCFLSADDKGYLKCWRKKSEKWLNTASLQAHSTAISALSVYKDCVVTGSSDGAVIVWNYVHSQESEKDELSEAQRLDMKGKYPLDIAITHLPKSSSLIMAVSATEWNVIVFVRSEEKFFRSASLPGHEDWVKALAFQHGTAGPSTLTLASGSQDSTIRLWNIDQLVKDKAATLGPEGDVLSDDLLDSFEAALGDLAEGEEGGRQISMKRHVLTVGSKDGSPVQYAITFDALLIGHEAGITSVAWRPASSSSSSQPMLLSTSTDSSLILWAPSSVPATAGGQSTSLWINQQRFGDIGGQRLGGFVGSLWACGGSDALAWGWAGGWRRWRCHLDSHSEKWNEVGTTSGHNGPVSGVSWSPGGEYLISTSPDQTTRIHANINAKSAQTDSWHEIGRPQVHGYDLNDAVFLSATRFVSIADEKVARVFEAPLGFVLLGKHLGVLPDVADDKERPVAASVPPLGLSNKAVNNAESTEAHFPMPSVAMAERRPFEGELAISTLWPEIEKVFGHGYELHAIAASSSGSYVATACRATSPEHAGIKVYESETWKPFGQTLLGHQLTVTRIAFSPDDHYILSVSRDRSWRLFEHTVAGYVPIASDKSHARIIWDCAWSLEGNIFSTASRDKTVKIWQLPDRNEEKQEPVATIKLKEAATTVSFTSLGEGRELLAVGTENGQISVFLNDAGEPQKWELQLQVDQSLAHVDQIHRLQWRPASGFLRDNRQQLATCSKDGTLRILTVRL